MVTFIRRIISNAEKHPDTVAIRLGREKITYKELTFRMLNVENSARRNGLGVNTNVAFLCKPSIESLTFALGLILAGCCLTVVEPFTSNELFKARLKTAKVTHILADPVVLLAGKHQKLFAKVAKKYIADVNLAGYPVLNFKKVKKWSGTSNPALRTQFIEDDNPAIVVFTSGTTSDPKGVLHTLETLSVNIDPIAEAFSLTTSAAVFSEPMTLGLVALSVGATWIIPTSSKVPDTDLWFATPKEILEGLNNKASSTEVKNIAIASAPVLPSLVEELNAKFGSETKIFNVYGMTEMLPIAIGDARKKIEYLHQGDYLVKPVGDASVASVHGELVISGSALSPKYLHQDPHKELYTGDLGTVLNTGEIILLGRKKDMFIRGKMNIYPSLYEPAISSLEGVQEAVLVGKPDVYGDDVMYLAVTAQTGYELKTVVNLVQKEMHKVFDADAIPDHVIGFSELPVSGRANKWDRLKIAEQSENKSNES